MTIVYLEPLWALVFLDIILPFFVRVDLVLRLLSLIFRKLFLPVLHLFLVFGLPFLLFALHHEEDRTGDDQEHCQDADGRIVRDGG